MYKSVLSSKLEGGRGGYVDHVSLFPESKGNRLNLNSSENVTCMGDEDTCARARTHTHTHIWIHLRMCARGTVLFKANFLFEVTLIESC